MGASDGDEVTVGITDYAQHALGDVVFVELPEVGRTLKRAKCSAWSSRSRPPQMCIAPVGGEVTAINEALLDAPETLNSDPYGEGWMLQACGRPTRPSASS